MSDQEFLALAVYAAWVDGRAWAPNDFLRKVWASSKTRKFLEPIVHPDVLARIDAGVDGTVSEFPSRA